MRALPIRRRNIKKEINRENGRLYLGKELTDGNNDIEMF